MTNATTVSPREPGLLLRLTGPLLSWGERSHYNERDTAAFPTRSGLIGLLAAALGRRRHESIADLARLSLTVRVDRPGVLLRDLHTVGGGLPREETVMTAKGDRRDKKSATLVSRRFYLADAAFTVALTAPTHRDRGTLARCAHALRNPRWPLFLGRRSCPPEGPLLLGEHDDALHHLVHLPLAAHPPAGPHRGVDFLSDQPLDRLPVPDPSSTADDDGEAARPVSVVNDDPVSFTPGDRVYRERDLYRRTVQLPNDQYAGVGTTHLKRLQDYLVDHFQNPEGRHP